MSRWLETIIIEEKGYIGTPTFMDLFLFKSDDEVAVERAKGLPHVKSNGRYWFNIEDCHDWYAGIKKPPKTSAKVTAGKKNNHEKYNTKSKINKGQKNDYTKQMF